jgi:competence protein ComEA
MVAAVLATLAVVRLLEGGPTSPDSAAVKVRAGVRGDPGAPSGVGEEGGGARRDRSRAFVHVAGAVRRPGVVGVPSGARVELAVRRAGGTTRRADRTVVNLAARVQDGQQILVPTRGAAPSMSAGDAAAAGIKPSLAAATVDQLDELDGIGPTLAERIVEYRDAHGGFRSVEELKEVDGIGEKRFASLREALQP